MHFDAVTKYSYILNQVNHIIPLYYIMSLGDMTE